MPRPECVACKQSSRQGKLLRCLHTICVQCIDEKTESDCTIVCSSCGGVTPCPPPGRSQSQSLPNSYGSSVLSSGAADNTAPGQGTRHARVECDECWESEAATMKCPDCVAHLCDTHSAAHSKSKRTRTHTLVSLSGDEERSGTHRSSHSCPIHVSSQLVSYCQQCDEVVCEKCQSHRSHLDHKKQIVSIDVAAMKVRAELDKEVQKVSGQDGVLLAGTRNVSDAIQALNDRTESVSGEVAKFFERAVQELKEREKKLLDNLDTLRSKKLLPLEAQLNRLRQSQESGDVVSSLLSACDDEVDVLRMNRWLKEAIDRNAKVASEDAKPVCSSHLVFGDEHAEEMKRVAGNLGYVLDAEDFDTKASKLSCKSWCIINDDLALTIDMKTANGQPISEAMLVNVGSHLQIETPSGHIESSSLTVDPSSGHLVTSYRPLRTGECEISATVHGCHLVGSPCAVEVAPEGPRFFDPARCHTTIQLSNENRTARRMTDTGSGHTFVCGLEKISPENGVVRVRVYPTQSSELFLTLCNAASSNLVNGYSGQGARGWCAHNGNTQYCGGGNFGELWQSGDVIRLTYNGARGTVTGVFERTGKTEELSGLSGECYLSVGMYYEGTQVTIL